MSEPCRGCERKHVDFGGCRCQAALLTGDAANTDPACALSPHRQALLRVVEGGTEPRSIPVALAYRGRAVARHDLQAVHPCES